VIGIAAGGLVTFALGLTVRWTLDGLRAFRIERWRARLQKLGGSYQFNFEEVFKEPENPQETDWPTWWLGVFERLLFFGALWIDAGIIVVGWLALKVASKWQSWREADPARDRDRDLRILVTEIGYLRFLIGTAMNVIAALVGVGVGRLVVASITG